jgi:hypothetical protein
VTENHVPYDEMPEDVDHGEPFGDEHVSTEPPPDFELGDDDEDWLPDEPAEIEDAEPGSVGALSDVEFDAWLGSALAPPETAPSVDELIDWTIRARRTAE